MTRKNSSCYLKSLFWVAIYSLLVLNSTSAFGQRPPTPSINLNYLRLDFIQTSGRRAGLGGAFIGAATDESAGLVNPAGLTFVRTPGASLHFRLFKLDGRFYTDPGHHIHAISKDSNLQKLYPNENDRIHFTFGLGIIGSSFYKYDLSADLSADGWQLFFSGTFTAPEY